MVGLQRGLQDTNRELNHHKEENEKEIKLDDYWKNWISELQESIKN